MSNKTENELELATTELEKAMLGINPKLNDRERRCYLAGWIDRAFESGDFSSETREALYSEYAF